MKIQHIKAIHGPNTFHHKPVLLLTLDLEDLADVSSAEILGFNERLLKVLPGLVEHRCSIGKPGGFTERLARGTYFAHIIEHIALELSGLAGIEVSYGKSIYGGSPGIYKVAVRFQNEAGMTYLLRRAVDLAQAVIKDESFNLDHHLNKTKEIVSESALGPSTKAIVDAAERRGIPWSRLNEANLIQFGFGKNRKLIQATTTNLTSDIGVDIAQDKELTKAILAQAAVRVPKGMIVYSEEEAIQALIELDVPIAVKPRDGHQGKGVSLNLTDRQQVARAYQIAAAHSRESSRAVVVEEYLIGRDYRLLVVNGKLIAAAERVPAHVVGDDLHSIAELIDIENSNPLRGNGHENAMTKIHVDEVTKEYLDNNKIDLTSIPHKGETVILRSTANLSTGGTAIDVTDKVHREIQVLAERAARIVGLDICGIDLVIPEISLPFSAQRGAIIEVNAGPGIRMHHYPSKGTPRDVGAAIVDMMYPNNHSGRIPLISITGTNGKTTVARMIGHVLTKAGFMTGITTTDGIFINNDKIVSGDTTGPVSARTVLADPLVEVAVLETARGGIVRRGLGYDWSDIGIITNIQPDHIGQDGIEDIDDILRIKSLVAERVKEGGTIIVNADDEKLVRLVESENITKIPRDVVFFSMRSDHLAVRRHINKGGCAYVFYDGYLVEFSNRKETRLCRANDIPVTFNGTARFQIANCLTAIAACRTQGVGVSQIVQALQQFQPNVHNSGRANIYKMRDGFVMVDYGHNPDAFKAICEMTSQWHKQSVTGVIAVPGDRADEVIIESAKIAAMGFDRVIIREDIDLRGRKPGDAARILSSTVQEVNPSQDCRIELDEQVAMERAIEEMGFREVVVIFYDDLNVVQGVLKKYKAEPIDFSHGMSFIEKTEFMEVG